LQNIHEDITPWVTVTWVERNRLGQRTDNQFEPVHEAHAGLDAALELGVAAGWALKFFHYRNLLDNAQLAIDDPIRSLFQLLDAYDFERVIGSLEEAAVVETAYRDSSKAELFTGDCENIRQALIHAIRSTHPKYRKDIEPYLHGCITFLQYFGDIFTTIYLCIG
jgi:hypothetical protein